MQIFGCDMELKLQKLHFYFPLPVVHVGRGLKMLT